MIKYNRNQLVDEFIEAKASFLSLTTAQYQRSWIEDLQKRVMTIVLLEKLDIKITM